MNTKKKYLLSLLGTTVLSLIIFSDIKIVNAQDESQEAVREYIETCIERQQDLLGIGADSALEECNREALKKCVQKLQQEKKVIKYIRQEKERFLLDLGDNKSDWWEGQIWWDKKCKAHEQRQYHLVEDRFWFRYGWCSEPKLTLDEFYTFEEAKERCELDYTGRTK